MAKWNRFKWIGTVYALIFIGLYYWLCYRTNLWNEHRWIGFALGLVVVFSLLSSLRQNLKDEYLSRQAHLRLSICFLIVGVIAIGKFAFGSDGTEAFVGLTMLGWGIRYIVLYRRFDVGGLETGAAAQTHA